MTQIWALFCFLGIVIFHGAKEKVAAVSRFFNRSLTSTHQLNMSAAQQYVHIYGINVYIVDLHRINRCIDANRNFGTCKLYKRLTWSWIICTLRGYWNEPILIVLHFIFRWCWFFCYMLGRPWRVGLFYFGSGSGRSGPPTFFAFLQSIWLLWRLCGR